MSFFFIFCQILGAMLYRKITTYFDIYILFFFLSIEFVTFYIPLKQTHALKNINGKPKGKLSKRKLPFYNKTIDGP